MGSSFGELSGFFIEWYPHGDCEAWGEVFDHGPVDDVVFGVLVDAFENRVEHFFELRDVPDSDFVDPRTKYADLGGFVYAV